MIKSTLELSPKTKLKCIESMGFLERDNIYIIENLCGDAYVKLEGVKSWHHIRFFEKVAND